MSAIRRQRGCKHVPTVKELAYACGYSVWTVMQAFDTRPNLPFKKRVARHVGLAIMDAAESIGFSPLSLRDRRAGRGKVEA